MAVEDVEGQLAGHTGGDGCDVGIYFFPAHHCEGALEVWDMLAQRRKKQVEFKAES